MKADSNESKCIYFHTKENHFPRENNSNSIALEIGKDFFLPNASSSSSSSSSIICPDDEDHNNVLNSDGSSSASSSSFQFDAPRNEESHYMTEGRREKNRKAAQKCREKKKERIRILEDAVKQLNAELHDMRFENGKLKEEKEELNLILDFHKKFCNLQLETEEEIMSKYSRQEGFNPSPNQRHGHTHSRTIAIATRPSASKQLHGQLFHKNH